MNELIELQRQEMDLRERQLAVDMMREYIELVRLHRRLLEWELTWATGQDFFSKELSGNGHKPRLGVIATPGVAEGL